MAAGSGHVRRLFGYRGKKQRAQDSGRQGAVDGELDDAVGEQAAALFALFREEKAPEVIRAARSAATAVSWRHRAEIKVPAGIDPARAAPLLCAGITTYNALRHSGAASISRPHFARGSGGAV